MHATYQKTYRTTMDRLTVDALYAFGNQMQVANGIWRDQLIAYDVDNSLYSVVTKIKTKYFDSVKVIDDMLDMLTSISVKHAIHLCVRPLELSDGTILNTFNICYIGPSNWLGGSMCLPYVYSSRENQAWTLTHPHFKEIADTFNAERLNSLRNAFYEVSDIPFKQRVKLLENKGLSVYSSTVSERRLIQAVAIMFKPI